MGEGGGEIGSIWASGEGTFREVEVHAGPFSKDLQFFDLELHVLYVVGEYIYAINKDWGITFNIGGVEVIST